MKSVKRAAKQVIVCAVIVLAVYVVCRLVMGTSFTLCHMLPYNDGKAYRTEEIQIVPEIDDVVRVEQYDVTDRTVSITLMPEQKGKTFLDIYDQNGNLLILGYVQVGPFLTVFDKTDGGFTGDSAALVAITLFWLLLCLIMAWNFLQAKGCRFYSYSTIYYAGASIFALATFVVMLYVTIGHILSPEENSMIAAISVINGAARRFMLLSTPLVLAFSILMAVSNLALIRHEGRHVQNVLALLTSGLLIAGLLMGWLLTSRDFSGSEWQGRVNNAFENVYATAYVYFECMLAGSIVCGIKAARWKPSMDKDFIVILGCWFRKDGSLPPLLRGRVDCAVEFWRTQKAETGKEAILIPSGGRGTNECMPEAEAMRRYLLEQQIPAERIIPETQSRSTLENMSFSKRIIESIQAKRKTVFVTTNYHVFRSGIWAQDAGLHAEGIGSQTKWWFWPNAFMRECLGLLQKRWKHEILLLVVFMAFYGMLSMIL